MAIDINMDDFRGRNGRVDWSAYRAAQVDAGQCCYRCHAYIVFAQGMRSLCSNCHAADTDDGELPAAPWLRCPQCRDQWSPADSEDYHTYDEGDHEITCGECGYEFVVTTHVSVSWTSPAMNGSEE